MLSIAGLVLILKRCSVIAKFGVAVEAQRPDQHCCLAGKTNNKHAIAILGKHRQPCLFSVEGLC